MINTRLNPDAMTEHITQQAFVPFPLIWVALTAPWQESLYRWAYESAQATVNQRHTSRDLFAIMN